MFGRNDSPARNADRGAVESRDALLVAAAIFALIVAAFVMPPTAAGGDGSAGERTATATPEPTRQPGDGGGGGGGGGGNGGGGSGDGSGEFDGEVRPGDGGGGGNGTGSSATITDEHENPHPDCFVVVWDRLVPGKDVTVLIWNDGSVVSEREVWFDGRSIGRTSEGGRVDGRVPYSSELEVTAHLPGVENCTLVNLGRETSFDEWRSGRDRPAVRLSTAEDFETVTAVDDNVSATFDVVGDPELEITGEPFPGDEIRVHATVDDVPMRSATVTVNGREVGRTDENGFYNLTVPDDGTERLVVEVSRGDFTARETVTVLLLDAEVNPSSVLPLPGQEAEAVATIGNREARDVTVRVDGETVGTTDGEGRFAFELPRDPRATVTVSGYGQTATVPLWPLYLQTLLAGLLVLGVVVGSLVGTSRRGSPGATRLVAGVWAVLAVLAVAWIVGGRRGVAAVLATGCLVGAALATFVYRTTVRRLIERTVATALAVIQGAVATVWAVVRGLQQFALRLADGLIALVEWAAARLRAAQARLRQAPRSVPPLLWAWLAARTRDLRRLVHGGRVLIRTRATAGRLAALVLAALAVGAGYAVDGRRGALLAAVAAVVLAGLAWKRAETTTPSETGGESPTETATPAAQDEESSGRPSLRRLWRTFARWIVPGRWQSRTPGEVARAAVARGFPRGPVQRLTAAFREVEYGDRSLSDERYGRARAAFRALRQNREREGDE